MSKSVFFMYLILLIIYLNIRCVENKSFFGIGRRIEGDQLLVKDVLSARSFGLTYSPTTKFDYIVVEPITYVEIIAEENVYAEVNFKYQEDLVEGTVTAINSTAASDGNSATRNKPFEVLIRIYGFLEQNVNPRLILNRNEQYKGILEPYQNEEIEYDGNFSDEHDDDDDNADYKDESDDYAYTSNGTLEDFDEKEKASTVSEKNYSTEEVDDLDVEFQHRDKIIEIGQRQKDDYLIYETFQTSPTTTELPSNHSVVFYYVDSPFITYVKFIIFDHFSDKPTTGTGYVPPLAEYSHFSPHTLKAMITDHLTTSLFVQMILYGYKPHDVPVDYVTYLKESLPTDINFNINPTESPISPLQRLKNLINVERNKQNHQTTEVETVTEIINTNNGDNGDNKYPNMAKQLTCGQINLLPIMYSKYLFITIILLILSY